MTTFIDILKRAISDFSIRNPQSIVVFNKGYRVIEEGAKGTDLFLIQRGTLSISVKSPSDRQERDVDLRYQGDLIGETAILQRGGRRNASVVVVSESAELVRISRQDVLTLISSGDSTVGDAVIALWELAETRRAQTQQVLGEKIRVENKVMSVIMADIHDFTRLSEQVENVVCDSFLFEFMENSEQICRTFNGQFEDQGDGFKIIFDGLNHVGRAVGCAVDLHRTFTESREKWSHHSNSFHGIGLGIGVCTDCMSIRRRSDSPRPMGRIASHAINIAAAISKHRRRPSDVDVYLDDATKSMLRTNQFDTEGPSEILLEHLGRRHLLHKLVLEKLHPDDDGFTPMTKILFLASDPKDAARLRLSQEVRDIQEQLRLSQYRDRFIFCQHHAVRPRDLTQALLDNAPQIVHFSGHGAGSGGLCFEEVDGTAHLVSSYALSALFKQFSPTVKCVVLNACYSKVQADAIAEHIDCVIGMNDAIGDRAAIAFATGFYQALGAGKQFQEAYNLGCVQIGLQSTSNDESNLPVIILRRPATDPV